MLTTLIYSLFALDQTLGTLAAQHSGLLWLVLFLIIFAETGLVIFPILPGDSLLFLAGAVVATAGLDIHFTVFLLIVAAVLGDTVNYAVGNFFGHQIIAHAGQKGMWRLIKPEYISKTRRFFDKYGGFTIIVGRFVPIVRTFAPFLAGVAEMPYRRFLPYNLIGGVVWVASVTYCGYFFGNLPWVKENLSKIVIGIVVVSVLPVAWQIAKEKLAARKADGAVVPSRHKS